MKNKKRRSAMLTQSIDLDYARSSRLLLPTVEKIALVLVGCGGTGSWLAPSVVRVGKLLQEKFGKRVQLVFVDPDRVEAKNCYRQNFCRAEIGHSKADVLAFRYGLVWGMEVSARCEEFAQNTFAYCNDQVICIGCVDNAKARKSIQEAASRRTWWLDCGNSKSSGQVLLGCGASEPHNAFELPGFCSWLPLPTEQHPELLEEDKGVILAEENLSCADMAMVDSQGLAINQRMAAEASDYLVRMLITKDLRKYATYIDLESGTCKSKYIVDMVNCKIDL